MIKLTSLIVPINDALQETLAEIGEEAVQEIKQRISTKGYGKLHSLPGNPPFYQTGKLSSSVSSDVTENGLEIVATAAYASILEDEMLLNRPFMYPQFLILEKTLLKEIKDKFHLTGPRSS